jgi:uncharacterized repeat protein (TIGR01451 family)
MAPTAAAAQAKGDPEPADGRLGVHVERDGTAVDGGDAASPAGVAATGLTDPTTIVNDPTADATSHDTQSETSLAAIGNVVIAAFNDSGSYTGSNNQFTGWSRSTDGGNSFVDRGRLPASAGGDAGDPVVAASTAANLFLIATLEWNTGGNIQLFRSTDLGVTFGSPINATPGAPGGSFADKEWLAVDNFPGPCQGNAYLGWRQFGGIGEGMQFTRSIDGGLTWGPAGGLDIAPGIAPQGAYVTVGPDHSVYYFWLDTGNVIRVRKSVDCGLTFAAPVQVVDVLSTATNGDLALEFRSNAFPHAAVHPVTGAVFVVYSDNPVGVDRADALYVSSTDGGTTWSLPARLSSDATTRDQFFPTIAITPNGRAVMVSWYDRRNDPSNSLIQRFGRVGKVSAGSLVLNSDFSMSPQFPVVVAQDPSVNSVYMGDYDQITTVGAAFVSTWGDNRDDNAFHAHQPDIRYAKVPAKGKANMAISISDSPDPVDVLDTVTFTVVASNVGATGTAQVVFTDVHVPAGLVPTSAVPSSGTCYVEELVTCRLGRLQPGQTRTITIQATALGAGSQATVATVTTGTKDPTLANNAAQTTTTVNQGSTTVTNASTGNISTPLADLATTEIPIDLTGVTGVVTDVNVAFRLNHTFDGDLQISLVSPTGTAVMLVNRRGGSGDNFGTGATDCSATMTSFDDSAATSITTAVAPFAGTFQPEQALTAFVGEPVSGAWKLRVTDLAAQDIGTAFCVNLAITRTT